MTEWINAAEAAGQLGVSRPRCTPTSAGRATRCCGTGGKISLFDAAEVGELARRGLPRQPPGLTGLVIESALTEITDDTLRFRGLDALDLAQDRAFEEVSALLWTGSLPPAARQPLAGHPGGGPGGQRGAGGPAAGHPAAGTASGHRARAGRG